MPLLIAATDFSDVAKNATRYACNLAAAQQAEVMIIHSFMMPVVFSDIPMPTAIVTDTEKDAELQMQKLLAELRATYPTLQINGKIFYGGTVEVIEEYAQEHNKPLLIVVGNNNAQQQDTWPDSTLYEALKELNYPVLAVPHTATYHGINKVCFAFANEHSGIDSALAQLRDMAILFGAALHVLNVRTEGYTPADDAGIDAAAKEILLSANPT
jgi:nucleotide-binding universal stress UspA family protein